MDDNDDDPEAIGGGPPINLMGASIVSAPRTVGEWEAKATMGEQQQQQQLWTAATAADCCRCAALMCNHCIARQGKNVERIRVPSCAVMWVFMGVALVHKWVQVSVVRHHCKPNKNFTRKDALLAGTFYLRSLDLQKYNNRRRGGFITS